MPAVSPLTTRPIPWRAPQSFPGHPSGNGCLGEACTGTGEGQVRVATTQVFSPILRAVTGDCRCNAPVNGWRCLAAGRNEPAVPSAAVRLGRLGSGGSARRRCRPADSAGRTAGRHFGRPSRPAGPPPGGVGQIFGQNPRRRSWPAKPPPRISAEDRRRASPPFHSDELCLALE